MMKRCEFGLVHGNISATNFEAKGFLVQINVEAGSFYTLNKSLHDEGKDVPATVVWGSSR